jgi:hypothetical protein
MSTNGETGYNSTRTRGSEPGEMDEWLPFVELGGLAKQLACGHGSPNTCALMVDGSVKCW